MRASSWRALAAALVVALSATPAAAQVKEGPNPEAQVRNYLRAQATKHINEGYAADTENADFVRALTPEDVVVWPVELRRGVTYRVFAVCDNFCSDVDLDLYDSTGLLAGIDIGTNDKPFIEITPRENGVAFARIWLAACEAETCTVGGRVYRRR